jgi:hypothetical protein
MMALSIIITLSIMIHNVMTLSIVIHSVMTLSVVILKHH